MCIFREINIYTLKLFDNLFSPFKAKANTFNTRNPVMYIFAMVYSIFFFYLNVLLNKN